MPNYGKYYIAERLILLRDFIEDLGGRNRIIERQQMEDYLAEHGFPVEKKTLYIDLQYLERVFGMKLEYDVHRKGYRLLNRRFEPYELRLLMDSVQASRFLTREKAKELSNKVMTLAGRETQETVKRTSYVMERVRNMNDSVVKDSERIHRAIAMDRKIGFRYFHYTPNNANPKTYSKQGNQYIVSPYALLWNNGNYYLYAFDSEKSKFRFFRVDRMERISEPLTFERDGKAQYREKDLEHQKAKVFDMYSGKEYNVRMRFRNELAGSVIDQFGKDIAMVCVDDSHFVITVPVQVSPPFYAWVATFGRRVKIQSPQEVVDGMREFLQKSMDMYQENEDI